MCPFFTFTFFVEAESKSIRMISIPLTIIMSYLSYRWIEVPFRNDKRFPKSQYGFIVIASLILVFLIGVVGIATKVYINFDIVLKVMT